MTTARPDATIVNMQDIQVGNICKFEDFQPLPGRQACYKIGRVTAVDKAYVHFDVLLDIWEGKEWCGRKVVEMDTPVPNLLTQDWPSRIQVLS